MQATMKTNLKPFMAGFDKILRNIEAEGLFLIKKRVQHNTEPLFGGHVAHRIKRL